MDCSISRPKSHSDASAFLAVVKIAKAKKPIQAPIVVPRKNAIIIIHTPIMMHKIAPVNIANDKKDTNIDPGAPGK